MAKTVRLKDDNLGLHLIEKWSRSLFGDMRDKAKKVSMNDCFPLEHDGARAYRNGACQPGWREEDIARYGI